ncbi:MAG: tetratricopeptide repeat protein [Cyanobacteria bacterium REEB67]|nr:tetratricopeptide repeat protein [Cyanobacteria bacterium REEB67]
MKSTQRSGNILALSIISALSLFLAPTLLSIAPGGDQALAAGKAKAPAGKTAVKKKIIDTVGALNDNKKNTDFSYLIPTLESHVGPYWHQMSIGPTKMCEVHFDLRSDGRVNNTTVSRSSGDSAYDSVCKVCIDQASPYAPFEDVPMISVMARFTTEPKGGTVTFALPGYQALTSMADRQIAAKRVYDNNVIKIMKERIVKAQQVLGSDSPRLSESINFLANAQKDVSDWVASEASFKWAISIRRKANGPNSRELAQSLSDLGEMYRIKGDLPAAEDSFKEVINNPDLKPCPELLTALQRYAKLCLGTKRKSDAEALYKRIEEIQTNKPLTALPTSLGLETSTTGGADNADHNKEPASIPVPKP